MTRINPNNEKANALLTELLDLEHPLERKNTKVLQNQGEINYKGTNNNSIEDQLSSANITQNSAFENINESASSQRINSFAVPAIEFIAAKCPNCGGELRLPNNRDNVKCMYCGYDIIIQSKNKIVIEHKNNTDNLLTLGMNAEKSKNYQEAYKYYTQILEHNENADAWLGKGRCAGWLSTVQSERITESINGINAGIDIYRRESPKDLPEIIHQSALNLILITLAYTSTVSSYLSQKFTIESKVTGPLAPPGLNGIRAVALENSAKETVSNEFWENHRQYIEAGVFGAWNLNNAGDIANIIARIIETIQGTKGIHKQFKLSFIDRLNPITQRIIALYPTWILPKNNDNNNDCFIATATMGDFDHPYVISLRRFRDLNLLPYPTGIKFVNFYYRFSPYFADIISKSKNLRHISLFLLIKPLAEMAEWSNNQKE